MKPKKESIRQVFGTVFSKTFDCDDEFVRANEDSWDSLQHIRLILALEETMKRSLTDKEITKINSLQSALFILCSEDHK